MRDVCDQCQRVIPSWRKPVLHERRIFCSEVCVKHRDIVEDSIHGALETPECYQIAASSKRIHVAGNAW